MMVKMAIRKTNIHSDRPGRGLWALMLMFALLLGGVVPFTSTHADYRQPSLPFALVGPVLITVPNTAPLQKTFTFTTPAGVLAPYTLSVQNGDGSSVPQISEGTIWLDDVQIAGPNDFRKGQSGFSRSVEAGVGVHTLKVVLRGRASSGIRLTLSGRKLLPVPVSATPSPLDVAVGATANVTVTVSPAPTKSGYLAAASLDREKATVPLFIPYTVGQTQISVPVKGVAVGTTKIGLLLNLKTLIVPVNVVPAGAKVASLSPPLTTLNKGGQATVTVALRAAQTSATNIALTSSPGGLVSHPATVSIPAGALQASFVLQGLAAGSGQLTASVNGSQVTSQFTVVAQPPSVVSLLPVTSQIAANASENLTLSLNETVNVNTAVAVTTSPAGVVTAPASVTVPAGASQTQVLVQGQTPGTATVRATLNGSAAEAAVQVTSPPVEIAELLPPSLELVNGAQGTFTLKLNGAQPEAVEVTLSTNPGGIVSAPTSVIIPAGTLQTTFQVQALAVGQAQLTATLNGKSKEVTINVIPQPLALVSLLPSGLDLQPGAAGSLTLTANAAQLAASTIVLTASPSGIAQIPTSITLPAGQTTVAVPVTGLAEGQTTVTASYNSSTVSALVKVNPPPPVVSAIAPTTASTPKGRPVSLTVKLDRVPTQTQSVALASSDSAVASVPATVTVAAGSAEAVFAVMAAQTGVAQISASLNGGNASASVTVTPPEVVTIALSPIDHTAYVGDRVPYTAQATFTDATTRDITAETLWSSSNQTVAGIDAGGFADAAAVGNTQISAVKDSANQQTGLSVLTPPALSLSASKTSIKEGESLSVTVSSAVAAGDLGLEISLSGGGTGGLQYPISLTIPANQSSATFTITGQSAGTYSLIASAPRRTGASIDLTISSILTITSLVPASAETGSVIDIVGTGFDPDPSKNTVVFFGNAPATVIEASATKLKVKVPATAQTGAITLTNLKGTVSSPTFTVIRQQDFALNASPASQVLLTSGQAVYGLSLSSLGIKNFTGLASLKAIGLPSGVTAKFSPVNLALGQPGSLILTAASNAQLGTATITLEAASLVSGVMQTRTAQVSVNVQSAVGVTGVKGRFVTPEGQGIAGVRVNVDANQTISDAAGNFMLTGLPAGKVTLRMDATPAHSLYPIWPAIVELETGKLTVLTDWVINPLPTDDKYVPLIQNSAQDQPVTDARYPGVQFTIPAGVSIIGWDGVPKTRMAMERILPEKLPVPQPPVPIVEAYQLYFGTPMGGIPSQPIPITLPNVAELEPGEKSKVWYFDGSPMGGVGEWKLAGWGTISADGKTVTTDPGQGIPRFCGVCGLPCQEKSPTPPTPPDDCDNPNGTAGQPVTLFNGQEMARWGALSCGGITPFSVGLKFNPVDAYQSIGAINGSMGWGWTIGYDVSFLPFNGDQKRLIFPGNRHINLVKEADGVYRNRNRAMAEGMEMTPLASVPNGWQLKYRDGTRWNFLPFSPVVTRGAPVTFLTEIIDPQGNSLNITRSSTGRIQTVGTPQRQLNFTYGANGFADKISDTAGREVRFTYTADHFINSITNADGGVTRYTYRGDDEIPPASICTFAMPPGGQRIKTIEHPGIATPVNNTYGSSRRILKQSSHLGEISIAYKVTGACITNTSDLNKACTANCPTEDSWDNFQAGWRFHGGQVTGARITDPLGKTRRVAFDPQGRILENEDYEGQITRNQYDSQGRLTRSTDNLGRVTKYAYDANGNVISEQDPLGRITDTQYDSKWNAPTSITRYLDNGTPVTTQTQYHASLGQPTKLIDAENRATTLGYTSRGELQSLTDPLSQQTQLAYNAAGDLVEAKDPLGNLTRMQTDGAGRSIKTTTPKGFDWLLSYNGASQPKDSTDPTGGQIRQVYDDANRLISIWDQNGHPVETYAYDARGNIFSKTDATNKAETYQYDSANRLIQTTTRKGEVINYAYDGQDRLTQIARPDATTSYSYDAAGRLIQIQEGAIKLQYEYDQADRLTREVQDTPLGLNSVEYLYDTLDRRISRKVNGLDETKYTYNKAGQITQIQYKGETTSYQYDAAGRLISKTLPGNITQTSTLDAASRLTQIQYKNGATLIDQLDFQYDAEGNIVSKKLLNGNLNQDTPLTATYDIANRMTGITVNGKTYTLTYDNNGNLTGKQNTADPSDATTYQWDARNRLTNISGPGVNASFNNDPLGRRIQRTVNGTTTSYLYDGNQAIGEVRGGVATSLLTGLNIDEAIARYASTGRITQLTDQLGSVIKQINVAGATQSSTAYSPYGEASTTGDDQYNNTEYTARENDETGLYFYRARYYDPVLKRFVSEDPIGTMGGLNLYGYVNQNPVMFTDPLGLTPNPFLPENGSEPPIQICMARRPPDPEYPPPRCPRGLNPEEKCECEYKATMTSCGTKGSKAEKIICGHTAIADRTMCHANWIDGKK